MTISIDTLGTFETAWCPGCGNFDIMKALRQAIVGLGLEPHKVAHVSGIGQAAKAPHYINLNGFNGLHGRSLPPAQAIKIANGDLTVIAQSGDGCTYGEGGNHFLAAIRRNVDITLLVHDNQIYGLTKGQSSPTTAEGQHTKSEPWGATSIPFNPVAVAVSMHCGFVARSFSGNVPHLQRMIELAVRHRGFSVVDILTPCVSFNKVNTFGWYKQRCTELGPEHDPTDWASAMKVADTFGDTIPIGVIHTNDVPPLEDLLPVLGEGPLCSQPLDRNALLAVMRSYI